MTDTIKLRKDKRLLIFLFGMVLLQGRCGYAVTTSISRHSSEAAFSAGKIENVVVSSRGDIELGLASEVLSEEIEDAWSVNTIVKSGGKLYIGTSPNGKIYQYSMGKFSLLYEPETVADSNEKSDAADADVADQNSVEGEIVEQETHISNEHVFAMAKDLSGRLLAGVSGEKCRLMRLQNDSMEVIFEPNEASYIFAISVGYDGKIYLATGPQGIIYTLNSFGQEPEVLYRAKDKNILSLEIGKDGMVYAGSDSRGLVYKINPATGKAAVLYDSDQEEITSLVLGEDDYLYAAGTSAKIAKAKAKVTKRQMAGRPETKQEPKVQQKSNEGLELKIANTNKQGKDKQTEKKSAVRKQMQPVGVSYVYKISDSGYVTKIFNEAVVIFDMTEKQQKLFVGTGNNSKLYMLDPLLDSQSIIYDDEESSQITGVLIDGEDIYVGTANPAKLIKLKSTYADRGSFISDLVDAGQPAKWGKLQVEADIPPGCGLMVSSRSGNVKDVNDSTFSDWTDPVEVTEPIQLRCPVGRFCQYKLVLKSDQSMLKTPKVKEVAVASTVPNLAPRVREVKVERVNADGKIGVFKISYNSEDDNSDALIYTIYFRKTGWTGWIELTEDVEKASYEWDAKTVEDGRYEIKVVASDERSNMPETAMTGSRISDVVVVDNAGPVIAESVQKQQGSVIFKLRVLDKYSAIGKLDYTVDSNKDWIALQPEDMVFDTLEENFMVIIKDLDSGEHVIAFRAADAVGNKTYKTVKIDF